MRGLKGSKGEKVREKNIFYLFSHNKAKVREDTFSCQCSDKAQCFITGCMVYLASRVRLCFHVAHLCGGFSRYFWLIELFLSVTG